jgi:hypothetical protein
LGSGILATGTIVPSATNRSYTEAIHETKSLKFSGTTAPTLARASFLASAVCAVEPA